LVRQVIAADSSRGMLDVLEAREYSPTRDFKLLV